MARASEEMNIETVGFCETTEISAGKPTEVCNGAHAAVF